eukprot:TRINITY_DN4316_c0_g3_i1.p1 TRINITY_DN4316_c0_g3~~TRINITY_DN4316_c0_g3_i1.p1  ORF type:complete len:911 (-),score=335.78 TRINITY_DN4316_c0_g3_i1:42-2774(-)
MALAAARAKLQPQGSASKILMVISSNLLSIKGGAGKNSHSGTIQCIAQVDNHVWTGSSNGLILVYDAADGSFVVSFHLPVTNSRTNEREDFVSSIAQLISAEDVGGDVVWCGSSDGVIYLLDKSSGRCDNQLRGHTDSVSCFEQSYVNNQHIFWSGSSDRTIRYWDARTGNSLGTIAAHSKGVRCILVVDDVLWSGSDDEMIKLWDIRSKKIRAELPPAHEGSVLSLAYLPTVMQVWSSSADRRICCWDAQNNSGRLLKEFKAHEGRVTCLSAGKKYIWSGSDDKTIKLWDIATAKEYRKIGSLPGRIWCLRVVLDGKRAWSSAANNLDLWVGEGASLELPDRSKPEAPSASAPKRPRNFYANSLSAEFTHSSENGLLPVSPRKGKLKALSGSFGEEEVLKASTLAWELGKENKKKNKQLELTEKAHKTTKDVLSQVEFEKSQIANSLFNLLSKYFGSTGGAMNGEGGEDQIRKQIEQLQGHLEMLFQEKAELERILREREESEGEAADHTECERRLKEQMKANEKLKKELEEQKKKAAQDLARARKELSGDAEQRANELAQRLDEEEEKAAKRERELIEEHRNEVKTINQELTIKFQREMDKVKEQAQKDVTRAKEQALKEAEAREKQAIQKLSQDISNAFEMREKELEEQHQRDLAKALEEKEREILDRTAAELGRTAAEKERDLLQRQRKAVEEKEKEMVKKTEELIKKAVMAKEQELKLIFQTQLEKALEDKERELESERDSELAEKEALIDQQKERMQRDIERLNAEKQAKERELKEAAARYKRELDDLNRKHKDEMNQMLEEKEQEVDQRIEEAIKEKQREIDDQIALLSDEKQKQLEAAKKTQMDLNRTMEQKERDWLDKIKKAEDKARKETEAKERAKASEEKREIAEKYEAEIRDLSLIHI